MILRRDLPSVRIFLQNVDRLRDELDSKKGDYELLVTPLEPWIKFRLALLQDERRENTRYPHFTLLERVMLLDQYLSAFKPNINMLTGELFEQKLATLNHGTLRTARRAVWDDLGGSGAERAERLIIRITNQLKLGVGVLDGSELRVNAEDCYQLREALREDGAKGLRRDPNINALYGQLEAHWRSLEESANRANRRVDFHVDLLNDVGRALTALNLHGAPPREIGKLGVIATGDPVRDRPTRPPAKVPYLRPVPSPPIG